MNSKCCGSLVRGHEVGWPLLRVLRCQARLLQVLHVDLRAAKPGIIGHPLGGSSSLLRHSAAAAATPADKYMPIICTAGGPPGMRLKMRNLHSSLSKQQS